jgi:hypothetical protein
LNSTCGFLVEVDFLSRICENYKTEIAFRIEKLDGSFESAFGHTSKVCKVMEIPIYRQMGLIVATKIEPLFMKDVLHVKYESNENFLLIHVGTYNGEWCKCSELHSNSC